MKKLKRIHICQIAILLSMLSIVISIVVSYWGYKENEYQLYKLRLEMQMDKNVAMMSEYEDLQSQLNEMITRGQLRNY
ncbi:MAG: hypothetical protein IJU80_08740 [Lachnospiraceae bacterium]|nr:hypothetical protein [Lachnospiraceae bacterium]